MVGKLVLPIHKVATYDVGAEDSSPLGRYALATGVWVLTDVSKGSIAFNTDG